MSKLQMGIDIGSTTAKVVVLDQEKQLLFSAYQRHNAETLQTLQSMLEEAKESLGDVSALAKKELAEFYREVKEIDSERRNPDGSLVD